MWLFQVAQDVVPIGLGGWFSFALGGRLRSSWVSRQSLGVAIGVALGGYCNRLVVIILERTPFPN